MASPTSLNEKEDHLRRIFLEMDHVVVAFSGGVDSAYLAWIANEVLGSSCLAVTADSPTAPRDQMEEACEFASHFGIAQ